MMEQAMQQNILNILREELVPALGCTEPIAIAYASACARETLGRFPESLTVCCSGNIVKNVKSVTVPNSNGLRGIEAAAILGAVGGCAQRSLEVLNSVTPEQIERTQRLLEQGMCRTRLAEEGVDKLYLQVTAEGAGHCAGVTIEGHHTNITCITKDGKEIFRAAHAASKQEEKADRSVLTIASILEFADAVDPKLLQPILDRQIEYNMNISDAGLSGRYGAGVAKALLEGGAPSEFTAMRARAAAASEARMAGCPLPVVINSGSGNQGITVSVPVVEYARRNRISRERLHRALAVSNLVSIHLKYYIGDLSAFCGAVTAACGAGAALAYLEGGGCAGVSDTVTNTLAAVSGIFCDGAKPSCAAKVSSALDAAFTSFCMAREHHAFHSGEGVVGSDVEQTIRSVGRIGRDAMEQTDQEILRIMMDMDVCGS